MLNLVANFFKKPKTEHIIEDEVVTIIPLVRPAPLTEIELAEIEVNARLRHALHDETPV
ncbi:hypothetical protein [Marivivens niveibacter]|nr:hypothetical protein [Marivivens niveibacter]